MSRILYNFKRLASGFPAQYQEAVARMGACTRVVGAPHGERQLERRRLERERQCPGRQQVERRQPGLLSQLLRFSRLRGSFAFQPPFPAIEHFADFFDVCKQGRILQGGKQFIFPCDLQKEFHDINSGYGFRKQGELLLGRQETRQKDELQGVEKRALDFLADAEAFHFGEASVKRKPTLISVFELDERQRAFTLSLSLSLSLDCDEKLSSFIMFETIISFENLCAAWQEFLLGKKAERDVAEFSMNLSGNLYALHEDLKNKTYEHGAYYAFGISDPKPRSIHKATVRDRVLHHAIYRVLYPCLDRKFICDVYSCRDDKGVHRAVRRFVSFARKVSRNNTRTCWILKCDVQKFFASVDQVTLMRIVGRHIPERDTLWLLQKVIGSFESAPGKGLPLGNLTSQLLVNIYMNEFDQFAKHKLKAQYYVRYVDDFVILSSDKKRLDTQTPQIREFLENRLHLNLHPHKVFIKTLASGVDFLGWVHFPDHCVLRTTTRRRMMKNMTANPSLATKMSYLGLLRHGNANSLRKKISNNDFMLN